MYHIVKYKNIATLVPVYINAIVILVMIVGEIAAPSEAALARPAPPLAAVAAAVPIPGFYPPSNDHVYPCHTSATANQAVAIPRYSFYSKLENNNNNNNMV